MPDAGKPENIGSFRNLVIYLSFAVVLLAANAIRHYYHSFGIPEYADLVSIPALVVRGAGIVALTLKGFLAVVIPWLLVVYLLRQAHISVWKFALTGTQVAFVLQVPLIIFVMWLGQGVGEDFYRRDVDPMRSTLPILTHIQLRASGGPPAQTDPVQLQHGENQTISTCNDRGKGNALRSQQIREAEPRCRVISRTGNAIVVLSFADRTGPRVIQIPIGIIEYVETRKPIKVQPG